MGLNEHDKLTNNINKIIKGELSSDSESEIESNSEDEILKLPEQMKEIKEILEDFTIGNRSLHKNAIDNAILQLGKHLEMNDLSDIKELDSELLNEKLNELNKNREKWDIEEGIAIYDEMNKISDQDKFEIENLEKQLADKLKNAN